MNQSVETREPVLPELVKVQPLQTGFWRDPHQHPSHSVAPVRGEALGRDRTVTVPIPGGIDRRETVSLPNLLKSWF